MGERDGGDEGRISYLRLDERVPADHALRTIRALTDEALALPNERFEALYSRMGRPSIKPEYLLRSTLLQAFFRRRIVTRIMWKLLPNCS
jgi:transposase